MSEARSTFPLSCACSSFRECSKERSSQQRALRSVLSSSRSQDDTSAMLSVQYTPQTIVHGSPYSDTQPVSVADWLTLLTSSSTKTLWLSPVSLYAVQLPTVENEHDVL